MTVAEYEAGAYASGYAAGAADRQLAAPMQWPRLMQLAETDAVAGLYAAGYYDGYRGKLRRDKRLVGQEAR